LVAALPGYNISSGSWMEIDRQTFDQQRSRRFGNANPQRMRLAFWDSNHHRRGASRSVCGAIRREDPDQYRSGGWN
jgi:hypothetical protein